MDKIHFLPIVVILLSAAVFIVIAFKRFNLSPVLGYLVAGAAIGEFGLNIVTAKQTHLLAEFGVVFLLFAIGLELSFERLKAMRKYVLGLGSLQVSLSALVISGAIVLFTNDTSAAIIIGGGLALSSTAIVLQVIEESRSQSSQVGRTGLAILLMQDFVVVPLLVIVPLLSKNHDSLILQAVGGAFLKAMVALVAIFVVGRIVLRPLFKLISSEKSETSNELFIAVTLLIVLSAAWGTEYLGLSLALGAFVAGILVAETEFRTKAEESIHPFKGLFLGLFFMSVGMTIDVQEIFNQMDKILIFSFALLTTKALIIIGLCILFGMSKSVAVHTGFMLAQGGEFAFILFNLGIKNNVLDPDVGKLLLLVVTFTMALTPFLESVGRYLGGLLDEGSAKVSPIREIGVGASDLTNHVIIAGFGQVGKMLAKVLEAEDINYIALDISDKLVTEEKESGFPIFKGDVSQMGTLKAAGADRALCIVLATENHVTLKKSLKTISTNFPGLEVVIRAKDLNRSAELYEAGATTIIPVDYETGLQLGGAVLKYANISEYEIVRIKSQFRAGNYVTAQIDEDLFDARDNE